MSWQNVNHFAVIQRGDSIKNIHSVSALRNLYRNDNLIILIKLHLT